MKYKIKTISELQKHLHLLSFLGLDLGAHNNYNINK